MDEQDFKPYNENKDTTSQDNIPKSVRHWVLLPIIGFTVFGAGALVYILSLLVGGTVESELAWPALIVAFAGLPSVLVTRVRGLMEAVKMTVP